MIPKLKLSEVLGKAQEVKKVLQEEGLDKAKDFASQIPSTMGLATKQDIEEIHERLDKLTSELRALASKIQ